jgi:hypothetical protein
MNNTQKTTRPERQAKASKGVSSLYFWVISMLFDDSFRF